MLKKFLIFICQALNLLTKILDFLSHFALLGVRLYLFDIFFRSGWLKLYSWPGTLALFTYEFKVFWISPETAAILGTACELILPCFLLIGLGSRLPAFILFFSNIISVLSYPLLLQPDHFCALKDHILWGVLIAWLMFQGNGKISLDYLLQSKICKEYKI